jgi:hypothetical protein
LSADNFPRRSMLLMMQEFVKNKRLAVHLRIGRISSALF